MNQTQALGLSRPGSVKHKLLGVLAPSGQSASILARQVNVKEAKVRKVLRSMAAEGFTSSYTIDGVEFWRYEYDASPVSWEPTPGTVDSDIHTALKGMAHCTAAQMVEALPQHAANTVIARLTGLAATRRIRKAKSPVSRVNVYRMHSPLPVTERESTPEEKTKRPVKLRTKRKTKAEEPQTVSFPQEGTIRYRVLSVLLGAEGITLSSTAKATGLAREQVRVASNALRSAGLIRKDEKTKHWHPTALASMLQPDPVNSLVDELTAEVISEAKTSPEFPLSAGYWRVEPPVNGHRYWYIRKRVDGYTAWGLSCWSGAWSYRTFGEDARGLFDLYPEATWTEDANRCPEMKAKYGNYPRELPQVGGLVRVWVDGKAKDVRYSPETKPEPEPKSETKPEPDVVMSDDALVQALDNIDTRLWEMQQAIVGALENLTLAIREKS